MFLHHLDDDAAIAAVREMNRVARRGLVIADLSRTRRAMVWINLLTLGAGAMVRHDARVSVRAAFTMQEARSLFSLAGVNFLTITRHFAHRWVGYGHRDTPSSC